MRSRIALVFASVSLVAGCNRLTPESSGSEVWKLPSGRSVRPLGVLRSPPDSDPAFLVCAYATSLELRDTLALRDEARDLWPRYLPLVQREGVTKVALQANASPFLTVNLPLMSWFQLKREFTFVANRQVDGTWRILGDTVSLPGVRGAVLTPYPSRRAFAPLAPRR